MELFSNDPLFRSDELSKRFEEIHDFIYANDGLSPQQTLEEFIKVLFIKVFDESTKVRNFAISSPEWQELSLTGAQSSFVSRQAILFEETKAVFQDVFEKDDRIRLSPIALGFTVNKLQGILLSDSQQDAKGLAFQKFLSHHEKKGSGQFFTPTPVIDFCVKIIDPKLDEKIIDPACGSGGFLNSALKHVAGDDDGKAAAYITQNLFGIDINRSIARIAKLKLLLEANVTNNIHSANSLDDLDTLKLNLGIKDGFDVVLTNPPFGAKISSPATLSAFNLGYKWTLHTGTYLKTSRYHANQSAETLFVERCMQLLRPGGRMGIVLPSGNFENPSLDYVRYYLRLVGEILAIVKLPQETFIPYGTGVKTSLLFVRKKTDAADLGHHRVFFGSIKRLGYQGNRNGSPIYLRDAYGKTLLDAEGKKILDEDFSDLALRWQSFLDDKSHDLGPNAFTVANEQLNGRLDYDFYSPANRGLLNDLVGAESEILGNLCEIARAKSPKLKVLDGLVEYVELSDVNTDSLEIINSTTYRVCDLPSRASFQLMEGDIITAIAGNSVGTRKHATAFVTRDFEGAICTNGFRILRNCKINPFYLLYFMQSEPFLRQMHMYRTGAAIPNVSDSDLASIRILLPGQKVQEQIAMKLRSAFDLRAQARSIVEELNYSDDSKAHHA